MLKSGIKKAIYKLNSKSDSDILPRIESKNIISFDVFDTLLKRDVVTPIDVFSLMEKKLQDENMDEAKGFALLRENAERLARESHPDREVTLQEIYNHMPFDMTIRERLMSIECQMEIDVSTPNIPMKRLYDACIASGKRIYFISDMYLPIEVIWKILKRNGYTNGELYVSSESGLTKRSGQLFSYIEKQENLNVHQWVHIGDAIYSDYYVPRKMGIQTFLIDRNPNINKHIDRGIYKRNSEYRQLNHFIASRISRYKDSYERIGYAVLGPLLYGFSKWLEREIPDDESIVFLAREGALLQRAFNIVSSRDSIYLYISRHAANVARLAAANNINDVSQYKVRTLHKRHTQKELAMSFEISEEEVFNVFQRNGLTENAIIDSKDKEKQVLNAIWQSAKEKSVKQYKYLQQYLNQLKVREKCALVDVGWHGTMQVLLEESRFTCGSGKKIEWNGYYVGSLNESKDSAYKKIKKHGFLFEYGNNSIIEESVRNSAPFCELLFLSTQGTTKKYAKNDGGEIYPVLGKPENINVLNEKIILLQEAGIQFVQDMKSSMLDGYLSMDGIVSSGNYLALAAVPKLSTIELFGKFNSEDGFVYKIISDHNLGYYLFHPITFFYDFIQKPGKTWFLKSVFKVPFPYISLLKLMKKLVERDYE